MKIRLNTIIAILLVAFIPNKKVLAISLNISELGLYDFYYKNITKVEHVSGNNLLATTGEKVGSNYSVFLPFNVQQIQYLVINGERIVKDQKIAILTGYDVHHFLDEFAAAQALFENADKQYQSSLRLYKNKVLKQSQWIEISKNYFEAQLRFEHLHHYKSFLNIDKNGQISIIAPTAGIIRYSNNFAAKTEEELLFDVIPDDAIRLKVVVPLKNIENLGHIQVVGQQCTLEVDTKEKIINGYTAVIWSKSITNECTLTLGQKVVITPVYDQTAFVINKSAVFEFDNHNYIAIKRGEQLDLVSISILNSINDHYIFASETDVNNAQALVTSVSAVQGVLLNLGDE